MVNRQTLATTAPPRRKTCGASSRSTGGKASFSSPLLLGTTAAIGDDKENMERIYGDSFLDITDLNQLPVKLTQVVKRFLRV